VKDGFGVFGGVSEAGKVQEAERLIVGEGAVNRAASPRMVQPTLTTRKARTIHNRLVKGSSSYA